MENSLENQFPDPIRDRILSRFSNTADNHHGVVCGAVILLSQALKEKGFVNTSLAYLHGILWGISNGCASPNPEPRVPDIEALVTLLFFVMSEFDITGSTLRERYDRLTNVLIPFFRLESIGPNGIIPGLRCISRILTSVDVAWVGVAQLYGVLVRYITDKRTEVREQSRVCLLEVLKNYQMYGMHTHLASASEDLTKVFGQFLLLAGGSNINVSKGPEGAQGVLYVLDALEYCLPCMSSVSSTSILKSFKSLLELRQPLVTHRMMDDLKALCLDPSGEFSLEDLFNLLCSLAEPVPEDDLLCFLATSVSADESSVDSVTFTVRLLNIGMRTIYYLNRQMCVDKLPIVFSALGAISREHKEALKAAMQAYKSLIQTCIDESLIKQGVDMLIGMDSRIPERKRKILKICSDMYKTDNDIPYEIRRHLDYFNKRDEDPNIIERLCATVGSLLDHQYSASWDMSFQVVAAMFDKLGQYSSYFLWGALKSLADMQELPDKDFPFRKQLHCCVGSALGAMGPETFLNFLPLKLDAQDLSEANLWLFPILKEYMVGARLSFFTESILSLVGVMKQKSKTVDQEGRIDLAWSVDEIIYSLWSLLPSFCNYPLDTAQSFEDLEKALSSALREEPGVCNIICLSLQLLIQQNKSILEAEDEISVTERSISEKRAISQYDSQVAADNLSALRYSAHELLSVLSEVFLKSSEDTSGYLQGTIGELASISDKQVVARFFSTIMRKLLKVTQAAGEAGNSRISMQVDESPVENSLSVARAQLFDLAGSLLPGLDAKEIDLLFVALKPGLKDAEILVQKKAYKVLSTMLKTNKKTRNKAYDIIVQIGLSCGDEEKGGRKENLHQFFNMVARGLDGETPDIISAALKGLAHLCHEFSDLISAAYNILPSTFLLLQRKNRAIIKASLGLLEVLVEKSQTESLRTHLKVLVEGLFRWQGSSKNCFKAKIKSLLKMIVQKCDMEAVKGVMLEEHTKLLTNIEKQIKKRRERKLVTNAEERRSQMLKASTSTFTSRQMKTSLSKSGASSIRSKRTRKSAKSLPEDLFDQVDDEPLDLLLNRSRTRSALRSSKHLKRKPESNDEVEIGAEGRLVIQESKQKLKTKREIPSDGDADFDMRSQVESHVSSMNSQKAKKRRKTSKSGSIYTGNEYASKKAGGDAKRKDKLKLYACWPLSRKMLCRRPKHKASSIPSDSLNELYTRIKK